MPQRVPLILGKKSDRAIAPAESVERVLNAYLDSAPTGREPTPIYGTPGLKLWASGLDGMIRGELEMGETGYVVAGNVLYSLDSAGAATNLGGIPNMDNVSMAGDRTNVVLTTLGSIYVWNQADGLQLVTDPDAQKAGAVAWSDGYFIFHELNDDLTPTETYFLSGLAAPIDYDALDFASAEENPDSLVTVFVHHRILYLPGTKSIEAAQNTGGTDFPFTRYDSIVIDVGLAGRDAICHSNDAIFLQADDNTIRRLDGLTATKISTARISKIIAGWSDKAATVATADVFADHLFVVFRNPDGCVVWDQNTQLWHERGPRTGTWRARHMMRCYGKTLYGSATEGKIFELDADTFTDDGDVLPFEVTTPYVYVQNQKFVVSDVEVVAQTGVGSNTLDPKLTMERTKDGETWSDRRLRSLGKTGEREKRIAYGPQGQARAMAFRFGIYDDCRRAILGAYVEVDV